MITRTSYGLHAALAALAVLGWGLRADAQTAAGTSIDNLATVSYSVGGLVQEPIESSPTGNTTPGTGAGELTSFLVDQMVDLTVAQLSNTTITTPGTVGAALVFTVTNTGNAPQGYELSFVEEAGTDFNLRTDNVDFGNLVIRVDEDPSAGDGTGNGAYDGTETATAIDELNPNQTITVFVVSPTVPLTLADLAVANVRLQARTAVAGTGGATLEIESPEANDPATVQVLFADDLRDGLETAVDQFFVQSASLSVTKTHTVLDDGFGSVSPRAIPGATVEYTIAIENSSATTAADGVSILDQIAADVAFVGQNVAIGGGAAASCTADPGDADVDGCGLTAGELSVDSSVLGSIAAGASVTVSFQVTIN